MTQADRLLAAAAVSYALGVFCVGFLLGALRVTTLAPVLGATGAVLLELPIMLGVSWFVSGYLMRRFAVAPGASRLVVGGVALLLLLIAEAVLGTVGLGRTLAQHIASYATVPAAIGLMGQFAFALIPWLQGWR